MHTWRKEPMYSGLGRRNGTVAEIKVGRVIKLAADDDKKRNYGQPRRTVSPLTPKARALNYQRQTGDRITPAQRRRSRKKTWRTPGWVGSSPAPVAAEQLTPARQRSLAQGRVTDLRR